MIFVVKSHFHRRLPLPCIIKNKMIQVTIFYSANRRRHFLIEFGLIFRRFQYGLQIVSLVLWRLASKEEQMHNFHHQHNISQYFNMHEVAVLIYDSNGQ